MFLLKSLNSLFSLSGKIPCFTRAVATLKKSANGLVHMFDAKITHLISSRPRRALKPRLFNLLDYISILGITSKCNDREKYKYKLNLGLKLQLVAPLLSAGESRGKSPYLPHYGKTPPPQ